MNEVYIFHGFCQYGAAARRCNVRQIVRNTTVTIVVERHADDDDKDGDDDVDDVDYPLTFVAL